VVVSATPGYDLRLKYEHPEHKGTHGSLHREHMVVPVISNVKIDTDCLRTVDVFPTYLRLMGRNIPDNIDGKPLI
jgi:predicted AlkP superfamily phosphohydrolase/phosphomutase